MPWSVAWIQRRVPRWAEILGVVRGGVGRFYGSPKFHCFHRITWMVISPILGVFVMYILHPLFPIKGGMIIPNIEELIDLAQQHTY